MGTADAEGQWLVSLDPSAKARFLASLSHQLTIAGRDSYVVQSHGLTKPELLRGINEIQHRVSACLSQLLSGNGNSSFERSIASWVLESSNEDLNAHGATIWQSAKKDAQRTP